MSCHSFTYIQIVFRHWSKLWYFFLNCIDRTVGNCGSLEGAFWIINAHQCLLLFLESKPWDPSLEWEAMAKHIPEIGNEWKKITSMFNKWHNSYGIKEKAICKY